MRPALPGLYAISVTLPGREERLRSRLRRRVELVRKKIAMSLVSAAVALVAGLSVLVVATEPAEAAFAGRNGKIVYTSDGD
jgi:hypothetical protein